MRTSESAMRYKLNVLELAPARWLLVPNPAPFAAANLVTFRVNRLH